MARLVVRGGGGWSSDLTMHMFCFVFFQVILGFPLGKGITRIEKIYEQRSPCNPYDGSEIAQKGL